MRYLLSTDEVICWLLIKGNADAVIFTAKKLQKMLYYVYAWGLVFLNDDQDALDTAIFDGRFEAWVHGPVDPNVYRESINFDRAHGYADLAAVTNSLSVVVADLLQQVWSTYANLSEYDLEYLTHQELPWQEKRMGHGPLERVCERLSDQTIFRFYSQYLMEAKDE